MFWTLEMANPADQTEVKNKHTKKMKQVNQQVLIRHQGMAPDHEVITWTHLQHIFNTDVQRKRKCRIVTPID